MHRRGSIGTLALAAALLVPFVGAEAFDETRYPDLKGQWRRAETGTFRFDQSIWK
jgi:hypothetical protein